VPLNFPLPSEWHFKHADTGAVAVGLSAACQAAREIPSFWCFWALTLTISLASPAYARVAAEKKNTINGPVIQLLFFIELFFFKLSYVFI
jgi:hypothetical protein